MPWPPARIAQGLDRHTLTRVRRPNPPVPRPAGRRPRDRRLLLRRARLPRDRLRASAEQRRRLRATRLSKASTPASDSEPPRSRPACPRRHRRRELRATTTSTARWRFPTPCTGLRSRRTIANADETTANFLAQNVPTHMGGRGCRRYKLVLLPTGSSAGAPTAAATAASRAGTRSGASRCGKRSTTCGTRPARWPKGWPPGS